MPRKPKTIIREGGGGPADYYLKWNPLKRVFQYMSLGTLKLGNRFRLTKSIRPMKKSDKKYKW